MTILEKFAKATTASSIAKLIDEEEAELEALLQTRAEQQRAFDEAVLSQPDEEITALQRKMAGTVNLIEARKRRIDRLTTEHEKRKAAEFEAEVVQLREHGRKIADDAASRALETLTSLFNQAASELAALQAATNSVREIRRDLEAKGADPDVEVPESLIVQKAGRNPAFFQTLVTAARLPRPGGGDAIWPPMGPRDPNALLRAVSTGRRDARRQND